MKRTLDNFFISSSPKRPRVAETNTKPIANANSAPDTDLPLSNHPTYPFPVPHFPQFIASALSDVPAVEAKEINNQPDLDLLYFQPYIPRNIERDLFEFLRQELFFYRVQYKIKRGPVETQINTPR